MQYKVLGADGREYGPVDEQTILQWISEGRLVSQSPCRLEGMDTWRTLAEFPEFAAALQKFDPGRSTTRPPATAEGTPDLLNRDYHLSISECISTGWRAYIRHFGPLLLGFLLVMVINIPLGVSQFVPVAGALICIAGPVLVSNPLWAGFQFLCLRAVRGQDMSATHVFAGFKARYWQVVAGGFIPGLLCALLPFFGVAVHGMGLAMRSTFPSAGVFLQAMGGILLGVGIVVAIYLGVCWVFTLILILDRGLRFWPAMCASRTMVAKHWWRVFGVLLVDALLSLSGALLCIVGVCLTAPLAGTVLMAAYETIFGTGAGVRPELTPTQSGLGDSVVHPGAQAAPEHATGS